MKAIVQDRYGPADVLHVEDIEEPVAGADEVLVRVLAASAFIGDWHIATGLPYAIRAVSGLRAPKNRVRGQDFAGRVEAVGERVTRFQSNHQRGYFCRNTIISSGPKNSSPPAPAATAVPFS